MTRLAQEHVQTWRRREGDASFLALDRTDQEEGNNKMKGLSLEMSKSKWFWG